MISLTNLQQVPPGYEFNVCNRCPTVKSTLCGYRFCDRLNL
jgi:hypothetical protein